MTTAHIVTIRKAGTAVGHQLRLGAGPGKSTYFSASSYGGADKSLKAARTFARELSLTVGTGRGGSPAGRRTKRSPTPAAGIRWEWHPYYDGMALYVVASWTDSGRLKCTRYSTEKHGLAGALALAVKARTSAGAPMPDETALLRALRAVKRAGPK